MLDKIITVAGSIAGILASVAVPILVAWITSRERARKAEAAAPAQPTFGLTLNPDAVRADRATDRLIQTLEAARDRAEERAERAETEADELRAEVERLRARPPTEKSTS